MAGSATAVAQLPGATPSLREQFFCQVNNSRSILSKTLLVALNNQTGFKIFQYGISLIPFSI
jgi:hypothetical protein